MRLIKILDQDNITVYLNPRFVQAIVEKNNPEEHLVIHFDNKCFETYDRESFKRIRELFGLT